MKARARCELKQFCCYINPDFSVKMSDVSEHSEFCDPKKKQKETRGGYTIKFLLTELGRAALGPYAMTSGQIFSRHPSRRIMRLSCYTSSVKPEKVSLVSKAFSQKKRQKSLFSCFPNT